MSEKIPTKAMYAFMQNMQRFRQFWHLDAKAMLALHLSEITLLTREQDCSPDKRVQAVLAALSELSKS